VSITLIVNLVISLFFFFAFIIISYTAWNLWIDNKDLLEGKWGVVFDLIEGLMVVQQRLVVQQDKIDVILNIAEPLY